MVEADRDEHGRPAVPRPHRGGDAPVPARAEGTGSGMSSGPGAPIDGEEFFTLLVQSVRDYAILGLDPDGRVTSWNEGAERIKGWTRDEILGRPFETFYPEEARASGFPAFELKRAREDGRFEDEGWRLRKDGTRFWANVVITALYEPDGSLRGYAKVTRDLTERREVEETRRRLAAEEAARREAQQRSEELAQLNDQLQQQATELEEQAAEMEALMERLEESNEDLQVALERATASRDEADRAARATAIAYRELDRFAYVASHDLKAPLRGISNLAQWIRDDLGDDLPAESREHMRLLMVRVHRMEALIDGILAYSRVGRMRNAPEPLDTGAVLADVIQLLSPPPDVTIRIADDMPGVVADPVALQQVFLNLIGNAVKHGTAHRPDVEVRVEWADAGDAWEFSVVDTGPGIAAEYHERIWEVFQTLAPRDQVEGTGIGLSVVRKILEAHGGRAWLESAPGQGAAFGFSWPKVSERG